MTNTLLLVLLMVTIIVGATRTREESATEPAVVNLVVEEVPVDIWEYRRNAVVRYEAKRWGVPHRVASAVSHVENYSGDSTAANARTGAIGIMQIHPVNFGKFDHQCYGPGDMTNLRRNACYGMLLLRGYHELTGNWGPALRLYLGFKTNIVAWMRYSDNVIDHMAAR